MKIIYRISDLGYKKEKPPYVTKLGCFLHFFNRFRGYDIRVIADNVSDETYKFLCEHIGEEFIIRTSLSNAQSFLYAVRYAIENFDDDEKVYFAEDDYLYTKDAPQIIAEGLDIADYSSGYDHPDKYMDPSVGGNPQVSEGGELSRVLVSSHRHWKTTNSFCMTFATRVRTMKEDIGIYKKHCEGTHPEDYSMCLDLVSQNKRRLISCLPAVSTHGETRWLSKFIDWEKEIKE